MPLPRVVARAPGLPRLALPAVLLGAPLVGLAGLAALPAPASALVAAPAQADSAPALDLVARRLVPPAPVQPPRAAPSARATAVRPAAPAVRPRPTPTPTRASRARLRAAARAADAPVGGGYACPVAGPHRFTDTWNEPRPNGRRHEGTDVMAPYGTPLVAVTAGVVRPAVSGSGGISLYLRGDDGVEYFYAHNSRNTITAGQRVRAGEQVGEVGTSGNAPKNAPHVHFERHPGGGDAVNPYAFLQQIC